MLIDSQKSTMDNSAYQPRYQVGKNAPAPCGERGALIDSH